MGVRTVISDEMRRKCYKRSGSRCEAMIQTGTGVWTRCGLPHVEVHHAITRSRGGGILDRVEEDYHLIVLCPRCHRAADGIDAYEGGILLPGYVEWNADKSWPVYVGEDEYLSLTYPKDKK